MVCSPIMFFEEGGLLCPCDDHDQRWGYIILRFARMDWDDVILQCNTSWKNIVSTQIIVFMYNGITDDYICPNLSNNIVLQIMH